MQCKNTCYVLPSIWAGCLILGLSACTKEEDKVVPPQIEIPPCDNPFDASPLTSSDSAVVFDDARFITYHLTVKPADWQWLSTHAADEMYVPAQLAVGGHLVGEVGLRYKGSYGTLTLCLDEQGNKVCPKLSMKIKFSEYDTEKRFFGLKRLNFHSLQYDASLMHDRLAYDMFAQMDIISPRATHAQLVINGESQGVFSLVEQIDGRFTDNRFDANGDGNLYKEVWPVTSEEAYYREGLKTNEETATHSAMLGFYADLENANAGLPVNSDNPDIVTVVNKWSDYDYLMRYVAVDRAIRNWDGIMGWYILDKSEQEYQHITALNHNYYWYVSEDNQKMWLIPWDMDNTFVVATEFLHMPLWNDRQVDCTSATPVFDGEGTVRPPACDRLINAMGQQPAAYQRAVQQLLDGPFKPDIINEKINRWSAQISTAVQQDTHGPGFLVWQSSVERLKNEIALMHQGLNTIIAGDVSKPYWARLHDVNDMEMVTPFEFAMGMLADTNSRSFHSVSLNTQSPLNGQNDLKFDFEFKNQTDEVATGRWAQYGVVRMAFEDPNGVNFIQNGIKRIRFSAKADSPRNVRVALLGPNYEHPEYWLFLGWYASLTTEPQVFELEIQEAHWPDWVVDFPVPPTDTPETAFTAITKLSFEPEVKGVGENGLFPQGSTDKGFIQVDDITFLTE